MKKRIFVCEDDEGIAEVLKIVLEDNGYEVKVCLGKNALTEIDQFGPDAVLLDLWLPEMSGKEIAAHLRSKAASANIPIMLISANRETADIAAEVGANDFLSKPFDIDQLEEKIHKLFV